MSTFFFLFLAVSNVVLAVGLFLGRRSSRVTGWVIAVVIAAQVWFCGEYAGLVSWGAGWDGTPLVVAVAMLAALGCVVAAVIPAKTKAAVLGSSTADPLNPWALSEREFEIARLLGQGLIGKEIAYELHIRPVTVKNHLYNMYRKTKTRGRVEMLNALRERGHL